MGRRRLGARRRRALAQRLIRERDARQRPAATPRRRRDPARRHGAGLPGGRRPDRPDAGSALDARPAPPVPYPAPCTSRPGAALSRPGDPQHAGIERGDRTAAQLQRRRREGSPPRALPQVRRRRPAAKREAAQARRRGVPHRRHHPPRSGALDVVPEEVVHPGLVGGWVVLKPPVQGGHRMKLHANAALSLRQRERMARRVVEQGWPVAKAAEAAEVSARTCSKWVARYRAEGAAGLVDRSSAPGVVANRTEESALQAIAALRRLRFTGAEISELLDRPLSTVSGILTRIGMGKLGRLGLEPAQRYERERPGELIHIDVKKLGRIQGGAGKRMTGRPHYTPRLTDKAGTRRGTAGWDYVHIAIDDC